MRARRLTAAAAGFVLAALLPQSARLQSSAAAAVPEHNVKAAFLCKFPAYVEWPGAQEGDASALVIGVLDSPMIADELERITGDRGVDDRQIQVRRVLPGDGLDGLHVLFVGGRDAARLGELLRPARLLPILTVTESHGALDAGSIINFTIEQERVRFEISLAAAERSGLRLSSRLLAVARRVSRMPET